MRRGHHRRDRRAPGVVLPLAERGQERQDRGEARSTPTNTRLESLAVAVPRISQPTQPNQSARLGGERRSHLRKLSFYSLLHAGHFQHVRGVNDAVAYTAPHGGTLRHSPEYRPVPCCLETRGVNCEIAGEGSKTAKKKPPFQHGNGGSIIGFTHQCRWWLCRDSRTKRNSAAQCGIQKCR